LFFRAEKSGDVAANMFKKKNIKSLADWFDQFDFDVVLLSGGGNDFVGDFMKATFKNVNNPISVDEARARVLATNQHQKVQDHFRRFLTAFTALKPNVPIMAHSYDYPLLMGIPGDLTLNNIGAIALFKKTVGDWISKHVDHALPDPDDQRQFVKKMMDDFVEISLQPLVNEFPAFSFVDFRGTLPNEDLWFDEMHPTGEGFRRLAEKFRTEINAKLPAHKNI